MGEKALRKKLTGLWNTTYNSNYSEAYKAGRLSAIDDVFKWLNNFDPKKPFKMGEWGMNCKRMEEDKTEGLFEKLKKMAQKDPILNECFRRQELTGISDFETVLRALIIQTDIKENAIQQAIKYAERCGPISEEELCKFFYLDDNGKQHCRQMEHWDLLACCGCLDDCVFKSRLSEPDWAKLAKHIAERDRDVFTFTFEKPPKCPRCDSEMELGGHPGKYYLCYKCRDEREGRYKAKDHNRPNNRLPSKEKK